MMLLHDLQLFKAEFFKVLAHPVRADALSAWMVALVGVVAGLAAVEAPHYAHGAARRFYPFFHLFVFTMLLAVTTDDLGFMWVAIEGTTLASVFLVNFERTRASLEAFYKDVLICSVGIAVAFLGTVLVYFADIAYFAGTEHVLRWTTLQRLAPALPPRIVEMAFVFLLVGYGTKAGLAPMHTWLPDAHSEAPAPVSAMMSGVLLAIASKRSSASSRSWTSRPAPSCRAGCSWGSGSPRWRWPRRSSGTPRTTSACWLLQRRAPRYERLRGSGAAAPLQVRPDGAGEWRGLRREPSGRVTDMAPKPPTLGASRHSGEAPRHLARLGPRDGPPNPQMARGAAAGAVAPLDVASVASR